MRELVQEIDSHVELVDLEVIRGLCAGDHPEGAQTQPPIIAQPSEDITGQYTRDTSFLSPTDPTI